MSHLVSAAPGARRLSAPRGSTAKSAQTTPPHPENLAAVEGLRERFRAFLRYAATVKNQSPASLTWYEKAFSNYSAYLATLIDLPPERFTVERRAMERWAEWNRDRGLSAISTNNYWRGLRAFFRDIEKRDATLSPFSGLPAPKFARTEPKAKSADDCRRIMEAAEHYPWGSEYTRALAVGVTATMLFAGLRRGEIVKLKFADVDLDAGTILVQQGKGAYGGRDRRAYVSDDLRRVLTRYMRLREKCGFVAPEFFISPKTKRGITVESLRRILERIRAASGVRFTAHMLRHSFVTHLLKSGVGIHVVARLAGHRQISTTMGYASIFEDDLASGIERLRF